MMGTGAISLRTVNQHRKETQAQKDRHSLARRYIGIFLRTLERGERNAGRVSYRRVLEDLDAGRKPEASPDTPLDLFSDHATYIGPMSSPDEVLRRAAEEAVLCAHLARLPNGERDLAARRVALHIAERILCIVDHTRRPPDPEDETETTAKKEFAC